MPPPITELCHPSWKNPNGGPAIHWFSLIITVPISSVATKHESAVLPDW